MAGEVRQAPHSAEHEGAALGSVLLDVAAFSVLKNDVGLKAEAFYIPAHRLVWEAMEALAAEGRPCDVVSVVDAMRRSGELEKCGGPLFLDGLMENTPTAAHAEFHGEQVLGYWSRRRVIDAARKTEQLAMDGQAVDGRGAAAKGVELLCEVMETRKAVVTNEAYMDNSIERWKVQAEYRKNKLPTPLLGLSTGLPRVDELLNGLKPSLMVLAARQSTGKTALEGQISSYIANQGTPVLRITQDSDIQELWDRDICRMAEVSLAKMERGWMFGADEQKVIDSRGLMREWPVRCEDDVWKIRDVCSLIRADVAKRRRIRDDGTPEPYLVTIDYLQLMRTGIPSVDNDRNSRMEECMMHLKRLWRALKIPILVLSQIARDKEGLKGRGGGCNWLDNRPILEDIKDSSAIEQAANVAILMSKVEDVADEEGRTGKVTLVALDVAKHKGGPTGPIFARFDRPYFLWHELKKHEQAAVVKYMQDEKRLKVFKVKEDKLQQPVFGSVTEALARADEMEQKKFGGE